MRKIVLASSSLRRREILQHAGIPFIVDHPDIEEHKPQGVLPAQLVKNLALAKALAVAPRYKDAIVISADTIVAFGKKICGKPQGEREAHTILRTLSGREHVVWTGFCIVDTRSGEWIVRAEKARVWMRDLSDRDIKRYTISGESLKAAGGYSLHAGGSVLTERIDGDINTILGLPLSAILKELKKFGVRV